MPLCSFLELDTPSHARLTRDAQPFCLHNVKLKNMSATPDLKACLILELLGGGIAHASVDYECEDGLHRFVVLCRGLRYELSFLERLLDVSNAEDITNAVLILIERIQTRAAPRRIRFGAMAGHGAAAL
jgi:hypothetical protein